MQPSLLAMKAHRKSKSKTNQKYFDQKWRDIVLEEQDTRGTRSNNEMHSRALNDKLEEHDLIRSILNCIPTWRKYHYYIIYNRFLHTTDL